MMPLDVPQSRTVELKQTPRDFGGEESSVVKPMPQRGPLPTISETAPDIFSCDKPGPCVVTFPLEVPQYKSPRSEEYAVKHLARQLIDSQIATLGQKLEEHLNCCVKEQITAVAVEASSEAIAAAHSEMAADVAAVTATVNSERRQREDALMALQRDLLTLTDSAVRERGLIEELYREVEYLSGKHPDGMPAEAATKASSSTSGIAGAGASPAAAAAPASASSSGSGIAGSSRRGPAGQLLEETRRLLEETRKLLADFEVSAMRDLNARFEVLQGQAKDALTSVASQKDMLASMIEKSMAELCAALTLQQQEEMQRLRQQLRSELQQLFDSRTPLSTPTLCTTFPELSISCETEAPALQDASEDANQHAPLAELRLQVASLQQELELMREGFRSSHSAADAVAGGPSRELRTSQESKAGRPHQVVSVATSSPRSAAISALAATSELPSADSRPDFVVLQNLRQLQQQLFEQFAEIEAERDARMRDSEEFRGAVTDLRNGLETANSSISRGPKADCRCSTVAAEVEDLRKQENCRVGELCAQALAGWEEGQTENVVLLEQGMKTLREALGAHIADARERFKHSNSLLRAEQDERQQAFMELQTIVTDSYQRLELLESDYVDVTRTLKRLDIKIRDSTRRPSHAANSNHALGVQTVPEPDHAPTADEQHEAWKMLVARAAPSSATIRASTSGLQQSQQKLHPDADTNRARI